ncbi:MAG: hypothetical protein KZY61_12200 [Clostridiaceae bacterium]|nr:hypothetical protein [Clostridiaceae bacterium]MBW4859381.1 hypothetical protein [Clostridiaceae bacterium]MBW4869389.1 hypothetical protein [Clostridiaceae bacterium]
MSKFIRYNVDDYKNPNNIVLKTLQEVFENEIYDFDESGERICKIKEIMNKVSDNLIDASNKLIDNVKEYNDKIEDVSVEPEIDLSSGLKNAFIKVKDNTGMVQDLDDKG